MQITGDNLLLVYISLDASVASYTNMIATCPDPDEFEQDVAQYTHMLAKCRNLRSRVRIRLTPLQLIALAEAEK